MKKISWKIFIKTYPYICHDCGHLHWSNRNVCERCGNKSVRETKKIDYKIKFYKYEEEFVVGSYEGHPYTDVFIPGIVYAHGFAEHVAGWTVKPGKMIGFGKTVKEAFRKAKDWIDKQN